MTFGPALADREPSAGRAGRKRVVVLGSTGSIGTNTLEVIAALPDRFQVVGLAARSSRAELMAQAERFRPEWVALTDGSEAYTQPRGARFMIDADALSARVVAPDVLVVVSVV